MISRHDRVRDSVFAACSTANLSPVFEQKNLFPDNNSRPGDIYLPSWSAGQPSALDVTITFPLQPSLISDAARCCFALTNAEDRKYEQYTQKCAKIGIQFVPRAFESFGGFSVLVRKTLKRIALLANNRNFQPAGLSIAYNRLSQGVCDLNERFSQNADRQRSPVMRFIPSTKPSAPQGLIYSLGSPNFSCPVIAVHEFLCHPMSGDNKF